MCCVANVAISNNAIIIVQQSDRAKYVFCTSVRILYIYTHPQVTDWLPAARIIRYVFGRFFMKNILYMEKRPLAQNPVARCSITAFRESSFIAGFMRQPCTQRS